MLPGGALAVVLAAYDDAPAQLLGTGGKAGIVAVVAVPAHEGDIGAHGAEFRGGGGNIISGHVVPGLQADFGRQICLRHVGNRQRGDVGASADLHLPGFLRRQGGEDHGVVHDVLLRVMDIAQQGNLRPQDVLRRSEGTQYGGGGCAFGTDQIDFRVGVAGAALEIAVGGPDSHTLGGGGLADGAAGAAGDLQQPDTGIQEHIDIAVRQQRFVDLPGGDGAGAAHVLVDMAAPEYQGGLYNVGVAGIGAGADENLLNGFLFHILQRSHIVRLMGAGDEGLQGAQVDLHFAVIGASRIRQELDVCVLPALGLQESADLLVGGEDGGGGAHFRAHIGDGHPLPHFQRGGAGAHVLECLAQTALDTQAAEHLQDHFLAVDTGPELTREVDPDHLGNLDGHGQARHGGGHVHAAHTDAQHTDGTAVGGVAVAAHAQLAGGTEPGHMDRVHDAVAGPGHMDTQPLCYGLEVNVVIGGLVVQVQQIVVQIADGGFHPGTLQSQSLHRQIGHHRVDVMGQGLVHPDLDLSAGSELRRLRQMGGEYFLDQVHRHGDIPPDSFFLRL